MITQKSIYLIFLIFIPLTITAIDNHHFYRASNFFLPYDEPRLEMAGLHSFDVTVGAGGTHTGKLDARNFNASCLTPCCDRKTNILNICGAYNMRLLGAGITLDLTNPLDQILNNLRTLQVDPTSTLGELAFTGSFKTFEMNIFATYNLNNGFFLQAHMPVRSLQITNIDYTDCSPTPVSPVFQDFLDNFDAILARYDLNIQPFKKTDIGDTSFLIGWTQSYQNTEILDFFDVTFRLGILTPTGKKKNIQQVFSLPFGYNGHFGAPVSFDLGLGIYEWFTLGFHLGALPFANKVENVRVRTDALQTGAIQLALAPLCVHKGTIWDATAYAKIDHCFGGISLLCGYTYAHKYADTFSNRTACFETFCPTSCDLTAGKWNMHTLHFLLDVDKAACLTRYEPHIGFFVNAVVGGENIFTTTIAGAQGGINFVWYW